MELVEIGKGDIRDCKPGFGGKILGVVDEVLKVMISFDTG